MGPTPRFSIVQHWHAMTGEACVLSTCQLFERSICWTKVLDFRRDEVAKYMILFQCFSKLFLSLSEQPSQWISFQSCLWRASILLSSRHLFLACSWIGWLLSYWSGNDSYQHADSQKRAHLAGVQSAEIRLLLAPLSSLETNDNNGTIMSWCMHKCRNTLDFPRY